MPEEALAVALTAELVATALGRDGRAFAARVQQRSAAGFERLAFASLAENLPPNVLLMAATRFAMTQMFTLPIGVGV